jgi:hypothetical protein
MSNEADELAERLKKLDPEIFDVNYEDLDDLVEIGGGNFGQVGAPRRWFGVARCGVVDGAVHVRCLAVEKTRTMWLALFVDSIVCTEPPLR